MPKEKAPFFQTPPASVVVPAKCFTERLVASDDKLVTIERKSCQEQHRRGK
jgi:hypothetical protein